MKIRDKLIASCLAYGMTLGYSLIIIGLVHGDWRIIATAIVGAFIYTSVMLRYLIFTL